MCNGDSVTANSHFFKPRAMGVTCQLLLVLANFHGVWDVGPLIEITTLLFVSFGWLVVPSRSTILLAFAHDPRRHSGRLASSKHPMVQLPSKVLEVPGP